MTNFEDRATTLPPKRMNCVRGLEEVGPAPLQIKRGALGPIRNRKTVEKIIQNRKTEKKFDQNRNRMQNC